jgi:hypothetical protein
VTVWRWGDYTLEVPDGSEVGIVRQWWMDGSAVFEVFPAGRIEFGTVVSVETGMAVHQGGAAGYEIEDNVSSVLQTMTLCPIDQSPAVWPYADVTPPSERSGCQNITFVLPEPAAGIEVSPIIGSGSTPERATPGIECGALVATSRSKLYISGLDGTVIWEYTTIDPVDDPAFVRYLSTVQVLRG